MHSLGAASANQACFHTYLLFSSVHRMTAYNSRCTTNHLTLLLLQWLYLCHLSSCLPFQFPVPYKTTCDVSVFLKRRWVLNADVPVFVFFVFDSFFVFLCKNWVSNTIRVPQGNWREGNTERSRPIVWDLDHSIAHITNCIAFLTNFYSTLNCAFPPHTHTQCVLTQTLDTREHEII